MASTATEPASLFFELGSLEQLVDLQTPLGLIPPQFSSKKAQRVAEACLPQASQVQFESDPSFSGRSISRAAVYRARSLFRGRVVIYTRHTHALGELCHYFDRVWILSGTGYERFVCHQQDNKSTFTLLECFSSASHEAYIEFLNTLEARWYGMKGIFTSQ